MGSMHTGLEEEKDPKLEKKIKIRFIYGMDEKKKSKKTKKQRKTKKSDSKKKKSSNKYHWNVKSWNYGGGYGDNKAKGSTNGD